MAATSPIHLDYRSFRSALARDLAWLLSPQFDLSMPASTYRPFTPAVEADTMHWLRQLDTKATVSGAPQPHRRLGHYFEDLVAFYLLHHPSSQVHRLQRNVALRCPLVETKGVNTIGELDFLFEHQQRKKHLEVAVKFYLGMDLQEQRLWLGPNSKDRLDKKWARMLNHQLPLAQRFDVDPPDSQYWLKGILFEPWSAGPAPTQGYHWLRLRQAQAYFAYHPGKWQWLSKARWLGGAGEEVPNIDSQAATLALQQHFAQDEFGVMLLQQTHAVERRCFVVADDWPRTDISGARHGRL